MAWNEAAALASQFCGMHILDYFDQINRGVPRDSIYLFDISAALRTDRDQAKKFNSRHK
jgi:hypothetical protein